MEKTGQNDTIISIIIPCYNASTFCPQLMDCIEVQLYGLESKAVEFILVNDGSNDNTLSYLYEIKEKFPSYITVIDQPNMGVSSARNVGIKHAKGQWIGFLDSDDILLEGSITFLLDSVLNSDFDVLSYGFESITIGKKKPQIKPIRDNIIYYGNSHNYYLEGAPIVVWRMLYRSSLIKDENIHFRPITIGEDTLFNFEVLMRNVIVKEVDRCLCVHIDRDNSLTTAVDYGHVLNIIKSAFYIQKVYNNYIYDYNLSSELICKINEHRKRNVCFVFAKMLNTTVNFRYREIKEICNEFKRLGAFPILAKSTREKVIRFCFNHPLYMMLLSNLLKLKNKK